MAPDSASPLTTLARLREEALGLAVEAPYGSRFHRWRRETSEALEALFGANSTELAELHRIKFQIDPAALAVFRQQVQSTVRERFGREIPSDFEIPQDHYYRERLHEAVELLVAIMLATRYPKSE